MTGRAGLPRGPFLRAYVANGVSQLGTSLQFVAVLWYAVEVGGPAGVIAVRVANTVPALLFGAHGGIVADRRDRKAVAIGANLLAGLAFVPVAVAGIVGHLPLWGLAVAGFVAATGTAYFTPSFGSLVPALVGRERVQQANGLVNATNAALTIFGWALAAGVLATAPIGVFFAVNAATYFASAVLLMRLPAPGRNAERSEALPFRDGVRALSLRPGLRSAVAMLSVGMTVMTGVWTVGIAELARTQFGGASALSLLLTATGVGTVGAGALLSRRPVRRKVFASSLSWTLLLPAYFMLAFGHSLAIALAGTLLVGAATAAAAVLLTAAAQESVPEDVLGRVTGVVFLANVGAKPVGLLLIGPLFVVLAPPAVFAAGALVVFAAAVVAASSVSRATRAAVRLAGAT